MNETNYRYSHDMVIPAHLRLQLGAPLNVSAGASKDMAPHSSFDSSNQGHEAEVHRVIQDRYVNISAADCFHTSCRCTKNVTSFKLPEETRPAAIIGSVSAWLFTIQEPHYRIKHAFGL